jgi:Flp pilus assembly protein TadG
MPLEDYMRMITPRRRSDDGAVAVEFALIFPMLAMLMMGILTGGLSYSNALGVQNAVREGARFGATGEQSSSTWAADVISRVRTTQFDDGSSAASSQTSVCVQLVKAPSTVVKGECSQGGAGGPILAMPSVTAYPAVPSSIPENTCVVRVIAARPFKINLILTNLESAVQRGAVARYERTC